ncbi:MAG: hypothetical protein M3Z04_02065 [Chloroflexota bacterium]|nr:hypothetical protein [Chloroflexota bacterium]
MIGFDELRLVWAALVFECPLFHQHGICGYKRFGKRLGLYDVRNFRVAIDPTNRRIVIALTLRPLMPKRDATAIIIVTNAGRLVLVQ